MREERKIIKTSGKLNLERVFGRTSLETLFQVALVVLIINIYESLGLSMIRINYSMFRSFLESAIVIVAIIIGIIFVINLGFSIAEDRTHLNQKMPWLILDACVETIFLALSFWFIFNMLDDYQILRVEVLNPFLLFGSLGGIIILLNLIMAKYYAKNESRHLAIKF